MFKLRPDVTADVKYRIL